MNEQIIIIILTALAIVSTLWLYLWRAIRQVQNENDERWTFVMLKAKSFAELSDWLLILIVAILITMPTIQEILIPIKRILLIGILFFGLRNLIELIGLIYYNRKL
ncbi:hypothetical protein C8E03_103253 [Lachnotalea glycerini]|uniref:Uncharacterized protein n=1 Tax=Lachnotalea glycerini TaxID=1763509 RepID=A0A318EY04_9FIRM|nr:hypothetical protein [Lachnotalea glycerini]OYP30400.1 hypothetical protein CG709_06815 [Lachnotalea glycerini]PXV91692.1 hypothetical protein C8E03_103253 [Lachnotalea glycerini]